jgi:hypothetical protein
MSARSLAATLPFTLAIALLTGMAAASPAGAAPTLDHGRMGHVASCVDDADCDDIPDHVEAAVGGSGIDPAAGTSVLSATLHADAAIDLVLASPLTPGSSAVHLPPGTAAGATPILLEFGVDAASGAFVAVHGAQLSAGRAKSIAMPVGSGSYVVLNDAPGATGASLASAPRASRFEIPECPCPASTSVNLDGGTTAYTITRVDGGNVRVSGLLHSAVGVTSASAPVCDGDADCDGISDAIEAAVGGGGIDPAPGTTVTSATRDPAGAFHFSLASPAVGPATVELPSGTLAGATTIVLELDLATSGAFAAVHGAQMPAGATKSMVMPLGSSSDRYVVLNDAAEATGASLASAPRSARFEIPPCPCPASTSTNLDGAATGYVITNRGDGSVTTYGLHHSAAGVTGASDPVDVGPGGPLAFRLHAGHPNPFVRSTTIRFDVPWRAAVSLRVYDVRGRLVRTLAAGVALEAGRHQRVWNGTTEDGKRARAGVYFYELTAAGFRRVSRVVKLR